MRSRKCTGVGLQRLWLECNQDHAGGIWFSQFCQLYRHRHNGMQPQSRHERLFGWPAMWPCTNDR
jgi:hypothetical protein